MDVQAFFDQYPNGKLLQVGKKYFLSSSLAEAQLSARMNKAKVVEVTADYLKKKK